MDSKGPHFRFPRHTSDSLPSYIAPESKGRLTFVVPNNLVIDKWFEDLTLYEGTLSQIHASQVDDAFKEELVAIQGWFEVLSESEKTTALFSLVRNLNSEQVKFFLTLLQQMATKESVGLGVTAEKENPGTFRSSPKLQKKLSNLSISTTMGMAGPRSADPTLAVNDQDSYFPGMNVISPMLPTAPSRPSRRLYDRYSNPNFEDLDRLGSPMENVRNSINSANPISPIHSYAANNSLSGIPTIIQRPSTPADEAISSADWSVNATSNSGFHITSMPSSGPSLPTSQLSHPPNLTKSQQNIDAANSPLLIGDLAFRPLSLVTPHAQKYSGSSKPSTTRMRQGSSPSSPKFETSDDDRVSNRSSSKRSGSVGESSKRSGSAGASHKEKGKIPDQVDLSSLSDIPSWLRSLRLHKYTPIFESMVWQDMINLTDQDLIDKGVAALGARRKMLKVFALVKQEMENQGMS